MPIPEVGTDLSLLRSAYAECGAVILRKAIPAAALQQLDLMCTALFAIMDLKWTEAALGEARADDPLRDHVDRFKTLQFVADDVARTLLATSGLSRAGYEKIADVVRSPVEVGLGKPLTFVPGKTAFRRQGTSGMAQASAFVPWHRDAHAVRTADLGECLNCWVPLHAVGVTRPSLQVVVGSNARLRDRKVDYAENDNPSDDEVWQMYGERSICTAILEPGDFMIFDHHTLHRTQPMNGAYPTRVSGELRFVSAHSR